jgi:hypothetical protein
MPIFTIEIAGRAVLAFVAPNLFTAEGAIEDGTEGVLDALVTVSNPDGSPLLSADDPVTVRHATEEEDARWRAGVTLAVQEGALQSPHEATTEGFAVYLVAVTPANDDDIEVELEEN